MKLPSWAKKKRPAMLELQVVVLGSVGTAIFWMQFECNCECNWRFSWFSHIFSNWQKPLKNKAFWHLYCFKFIARGRFKSCFPHHEKTLVNQGFSSFLAPKNRALNTILNTIRACPDLFPLFLSLFSGSCFWNSSICLFSSKPYKSRFDKEKRYPDPLFFPGQSSTWAANFRLKK